MLRPKIILSLILILVLLSGAGLTIHLIKSSNRSTNRVSFREVSNNPIPKIDLKPGSDPIYKTTCGGCHFPYPPGLLPGASWKIIIDRLPDHFGDQVTFDPKSKETLIRYLMENGADRSSAKKPVKIMNSLNGRSVLRITEIPYIRKKHRGIKPEIFNRTAIGSFSNCIACHKTAEQGNFDDDQVVIPQ
ncbi:MAG: diheme cytochrome c [Thermodesulfobacteriota bacterium]